MHLEHRHVEKMTHYEGSARIPLIVAGPGISHGITETRLTSLLDVFPTLLDVAGVSPPLFLPALDGYSLLPLIPGVASHDHRQRPAHVAAMAASDSLNAGQFMLRKGGVQVHRVCDREQPGQVRASAVRHRRRRHLGNGQHCRISRFALC
eukprot:SAG25_NODE_305_length_10124_cov_16.774464_3_plen_150_part_00